ncbi:NDP-sugar synthase [Shewanella alkalitolerans]|uniref:sugar phosphate nucleotidyltransferase n=1 Tax=Shewanella alkalitolerans TaxID=2864209 RepID=UPI001C65D156|nr:NDP-sugar synthase [Shewanella alkalitolerans]QYJ98974.1 NDP-sugar synthase [Shewanella alkalitolerans]
MQAIILANRSGHELTPLDQYYCPALLPVGNRALIEYTLDDLSNAGITQVKLVLGPQAGDIEALLGKGERWGLDIDYFLCRADEPASEVISRLQLTPEQPALLLRGDILRTPVIKEFIGFAKQFPKELVSAKISGMPTGMIMLPGASANLDHLNWPLIAHPSATTSKPQGVTLVLHGHQQHLDSLNDYLAANLNLASNRLARLRPQQRFQAYDNGGGCYLAQKVRFNGAANGQGMIGQRSQLDDNVRLDGDFVIGEHCLIDAGAQLSDSLILPNTYVGRDLNLHRAIVCQSLLINLEHQGYISIEDASLIAPNRAAQHHQGMTFSANDISRVRLSDRLLALALLLLTLPLQLAIGAYLAILSRQPLISNQYPTNDKGLGFRLKRWQVTNPLLASLPGLTQVLKGKLALFGDSPDCKADYSPADNGNLHELGATVGLWGPVQLLLPNDAPLEEKQLVALSFNAEPGKLKYLRLMASCFAQPARLSRASA